MARLFVVNLIYRTSTRRKRIETIATTADTSDLAIYRAKCETDPLMRGCHFEGGNAYEPPRGLVTLSSVTR